MKALFSKSYRFFYYTIQLVILFIILFFIIKYIFKNSNYLSSKEWHVNWIYIFCSFLVFIIVFFSSIFLWKKLLSYIGHNLSFFQSWKSWYLSLLGKYIPGKLWNVLGLSYFTQKEGIPFKSCVMASILYQALALPGFLSIFLLTIPFSNILSANTYSQIISPIIITIASIILILNPKFLLIIINFLLSIFKKEKIDFKISSLKIFYLIIINIIISFLWGISFSLFALSFSDLSFKIFIVLTGDYCLSLILGVLCIFAPGGIGVREGVLMGLISQYFSSDTTIALAIGSRLLSLFAELIFVCFSWLFFYFRKK